MSVRLMAAAWEIDLPDSQKLVLLALADCASDEGKAWPSIATIARKCSRGVRTVQGVMNELEKADHIEREQVPGKGCIYIVHPRKDCAPAKTAPPQRTAKTPAAAAHKPSGTITSSPSVASQPSESASDDRLTLNEFEEAWKALASELGLPTIRGSLNADRRRKFNARSRDHPLDDWVEVFDRIRRSPFLRGDTGNWPGANVDFLLRPNSITKILEGTYDRSNQ